MKQFEDLIAWNKAKNLVVNVYSTLKSNKDFGFKDQIFRASVSISNNIAEGYDRNSDKEFARFLYIATASCSEVRSMLYIAEEINYIKGDKAKELRTHCLEISRIIKGLIKSLKV